MYKIIWLKATQTQRVTTDYQMKTGQEEFSFFSAERCGNRFVLTGAVLLKAVTLCCLLLHPAKKLYICMLRFIILLLCALQNNIANKTLYHRIKIWSRCAC